MKRLLAMALALVLCLGLAVPALAEEEKTDVVFVQDESGLIWPATDLPEPEEVFQQFLDDYGYGLPEPDEEPTLTLMVNGVASDIAVTAVDGVSYVEADALRAILGDQAVGGDVSPVSVRAAAQAAGWDVAWYGGGWRGMDREVQLWDKAAFEAELAEKFGPFNDFMAKVMKVGRDTLTTKEPLSGHETVSVDLTRFSTLDGDKKYTLTFAVDYTVQAGVMDMTVTFDVSQLLRLLAPADLAFLGKREGFDLAKLTQLLRAGKMEFIIDYNEGALAYNVPLLAFMDEDLAGWQSEYLYGWEEAKEAFLGDQEMSLTSTLYASMVNKASARWGGGAEDALKDYRESVDGLNAFFGKDRFATQNGKTTWTVTTQAVNRALGEALGLAEPEKASFFKAFEMSCSLDDKGNESMDARVRFDVDGMAQAIAQGDYYEFGEATGFSMLMGLLDMDITASGSGNQSHSTSRVKIHWNNVGALEMKAQTTAGKSAKGPRQVEEVSPAPAPVFSTEPDVVDPGFNFGVIGGADGPTAILTTR